MNKCIFIGNITKEPELKFIPASGMAVCKFGLALNEGYGDKKKTYFINCTAFGKTAEAVANYTNKGSKVGIESRVQTGSYDNKQGVKVYTTDFIVDKIEFLDSKKEQASKPVDAENYFSNALADEEGMFQQVDDEDIPF